MASPIKIETTKLREPRSTIESVIAVQDALKIAEVLTKNTTRHSVVTQGIKEFDKLTKELDI